MIVEMKLDYPVFTVAQPSRRQKDQWPKSENIVYSPSDGLHGLRWSPTLRQLML
jgi:hypothetical protein